MHKTETCLLRHKDEDRFLTWLLETLGPVIIDGWRVYGDPKVSDIRFMEFSQAKDKMKTLLSQFSVEKVLYSF